MNRRRKIIIRYFFTPCCFALLYCLIIPSNVDGAYLRNFPVKVVQPDGEELDIFASGDEFYNWLHDKDGYTIIQDPETGYYVYAIEKDGDLISSGYIVDCVDPNTLNIKKRVLHSMGRRKKPSELFPGGRFDKK